MREPAQTTPTTLPGNHGQFGEDTATEEHRTLRPVQSVRARPVVPRSSNRSRSTPATRRSKPD